MAQQFKYRWMAAGDLNACFALMLDNIVNLAVFASLLTGAFGFPADVVLLKMIPGSTLGVMLGDLVYTWMAVRLARRERRQDVTAMPLGLDTPSTIGMALAVLGPAFVGIRADLVAAGVAPDVAADRAAHTTWAIGMAVMLLMGAVKVILSFAGDWIRRQVPQAGLLGSIGGIGLMLLSFFPLLEIFRAPVVGLVCLGLVITTLVARIPLPWGIPGAAATVLLGSALYYVLGPLGWLGGGYTPFPATALTLALPTPTLLGVQALGDALPYLPIAIPFGLLTIIGGINVTESARTAGDDYPTFDILMTEAVATLVAGLCGGVAQSTPFIGHPAYKRMGARAGYTLIAGLIVGLGGSLGAVSYLVALLPLAAVMPVLVFVGLEIAVQAFEATPKRHAAAVAFAFLPIVANLLLIRQDSLLGNLHGGIAAAAAELGPAHTATVRSLVQAAAHRVDADLVMGLGHGFILTGMLWGSWFALVIDRKLRRAAAFVALSGVLTLFGMLHSVSPTGKLYLPWAAPAPTALEWAAGYMALAALLLALSCGRGAAAAAADTAA